MAGAWKPRSALQRTATPRWQHAAAPTQHAAAAGLPTFGTHLEHRPARHGLRILRLRRAAGRVRWHAPRCSPPPAPLARHAALQRQHVAMATRPARMQHTQPPPLPPRRRRSAHACHPPLPAGGKEKLTARFDEDMMETLHITQVRPLLRRPGADLCSSCHGVAHPAACRPPPLQVALGPKPKPGPHVVFVERDGQKFAIGTLDAARCTQAGAAGAWGGGLGSSRQPTGALGLQV